MAGPTPIVRQAVLCERVTFDTTAGYLLHRTRVDFLAEAGEPLPFRPDELWLFIQVTGSYGPQMYRIRLVDVTDLTVSPTTVFETPDRAIFLGAPFGAYRLRSRSWGTKLKNVLFPRPGRYEVWVMFDGLPRARADVLVEGGS